MACNIYYSRSHLSFITFYKGTNDKINSNNKHTAEPNGGGGAQSTQNTEHSKKQQQQQQPTLAAITLRSNKIAI